MTGPGRGQVEDGGDKSGVLESMRTKGGEGADGGREKKRKECRIVCEAGGGGRKEGRDWGCKEEGENRRRGGCRMEEQKGVEIAGGRRRKEWRVVGVVRRERLGGWRWKLEGGGLQEGRVMEVDGGGGVWTITVTQKKNK